MMKQLLITSLIFFSSLSAKAEFTCAQLDTKLTEAQTKTNNYIYKGKRVGDYDTELRIAKAVKKHTAHFVDTKKSYKGKPEDLFKNFYPFENAEKDPNVISLLTGVAGEVCNGSDVTACSKALYALDNDDVLKKDAEVTELETTISELAWEKPLQNLISISQSYAAEYKAKKCHETQTQSTGDATGVNDVDCTLCKQGTIDRFAENVMDVVIADTDTGVKHREKLCRDLAKTEHSLAGCVPDNNQCASLGKNFALENNVCVKCTGATKHIYQSSCYTCPKDHSVVNGVCVKECSNLEIRQDVAPYACLADEKAQTERNLRKQRSKEKWGKVLRTSAIIAVAGGAAVGLAFAMKAIFKNYFNQTDYHYNTYNTYTGDNYSYDYTYKKGAINYDYSTSNPSYNYTYPSNNLGMGGMGSMGYSPYYNNSGYYNPYGMNPYGWY